MSRSLLANVFKYSFLTFSILFFAAAPAPAQHAAKGHEGHGEAKAFNPGETILHHVADEHQWHLATLGEQHYAIPLPVILYSPTQGLKVFSSSHFYHSPTGEHEGFRLEHEHITALDGSAVYDFSITKNVASLIVSFTLLLLIFFTVAKGYQKRNGKAPKGLQSALEPFIVFIRDEVAKNYIGEKHYRRFLPYLLTLFFFIWMNNLLGLLPGSFSHKSYW